jgi:hypothetical protein
MKVRVGVITLCLMQTTHAYAQQQQLLLLDQYSDTKAAFEAAVQERPVLEVLRAVRGFDAREQVYKASGGRVEPTMARSYIAPRDVTSEFRQALKGGALYIRQRGDMQSPVFVEGIVPVDAQGPHDLPVTVIYRDADGVHTRRFEPWHNIALPALASLQHKKNDRAHGAYWYAHQLEEVGRGLVTCSVEGDFGLRFFATNALAYDQAYYDYQAGAYVHGVSPTSDVYGPDCTLCQERKDMAFSFLLGFDGGSRSAIDTQSYQYFDPRLQRVMQYQGGLNRDSSLYEGPSRIRYPNKVEGKVDVWFAIDGKTIMMGTGKPRSLADITSSLVQTFYKKTFTTFPPFLRYFGLVSAFDNTPALTITNIASWYLDKAHRFTTPHFLGGRFYHWCSEWQAATPDSFSVTFSARGDGVWVALSDVKETDGQTYKYGIFIKDLLYMTKGDNRTGVDVVAQEYPIPLVPDDGALQTFWVSYKHGLLSVGQGSVVGTNEIGRYHDPKPALGVRSVCFSSLNKPVEYTDITFADAAPTEAELRAQRAEEVIGGVGDLF